MKKKILLIFFVFSIYYVSAFSQVSSQKFLDGANVTGITGRGNNIWVATYGHGIYSYSEETGEWKNYSVENTKTLENNFFYCIAASKNYVWAGSADGLYILDVRRNLWRRRKFALGGQMGNWIRALAYDSTRNVLWIGRFENLTRLDVRTQRYTDHMLMQNRDQKSNNFKCIKFDGDSLVWFGTESGVFKYNEKRNVDNPNAWLYINNKNSGFKDEGDAVSISDMVFDKNEVWFGTDEFVSEEHPNFNIGGIYVYDRDRNWIRISMNDGLPANGIYCMERTGNSIWAGIYAFDKSQKKDYGKGLVIINRFSTSITKVDLNELNIQSAKVNTMFFDGSRMWLGTDDGLCKVVIENPLAVWPGKKVPEQPKKSKKRRR